MNNPSVGPELLELVRKSSESGTGLGIVLTKFASRTEAGEVLPLQRRFGVEEERDDREGCSNENAMNKNKKYKITCFGT